MDSIEHRIDTLRRDVDRLQAESASRRLLARYMLLCDCPLPQPGLDHATRADAIGALFSDDGIWEGVGGLHGAGFGQHRGPTQIAAFMRTVLARRDPAMVFNTHYLCSEQLWADEDGRGAEGMWVQFQPWVHDNGQALLRSSRLHARFCLTDAGWRIARYRTENLFVAPLPSGWAESMIETSVLLAG